MNRLAGQKSAYLSSAARQPVNWRPWGSEAFAEAVALDKPILLDIGAVWCHWCHVMDRESYENEAVAAVINERYVAIKVDRDERPDVDARYQRQVAALSGQGGWPLTAVLTPDGAAFYGGTYFPPADHGGRPGFVTVLKRLADFFRTDRKRVDDVGGELARALKERPAAAAPLSAAAGALSIIRHYDERHGGFGDAPKFPHCSALKLLVGGAARGDGVAEEALVSTLTAMAQGGVHDHLAGGFHRYAVDERWHVPHFEKMLYDNAELLDVFAAAYAVTGNDLFAETARGIVRFLREWLADPRGGYYASQDADIDLDDDGDHFTWSAVEAREAVGEAIYPVIARHFDLRAKGDMAHDPTRCVLRVAAGAKAIAAETGETPQKVAEKIARGRQAMYRRRLKRPVPYVDTTVYANWNGMAITALASAAGWLDDPSLLADAVKTFDRIADDNRDFVDGMRRAGSGSPPGGLDDYAWMGRAALSLYAATGRRRFVTAARKLADRIVDNFRDAAGGYFDVDRSAVDPVVARLAPHKPYQDAPSTSANATALGVMFHLGALTGEERYRSEVAPGLSWLGQEAIDQALFFAGSLMVADAAAGGYAEVTVVGSGPGAERLAQAARRSFVPNLVLKFIDPADPDALPASPEGAGMIAAVPTGNAALFVCADGRCKPPVTDPAAVAAAVIG